MNTLSDEQLITQIKNGNIEAENEIFSRYKNIVTKISRGYFLAGGDIEDLIQEGMIGLYKAIGSYSNQKNASFKTFAILCIKHQIQTAIKKANSNKNKFLSSAVSLQDFLSSSNEESEQMLPMSLIFDITPDQQAIDKEEFISLKENISKILSDMEKRVLNLYLEGYNYKEISAKLGISSKSIDNSLSRIKTKLKNKLNQKN